MFPKNIAIIEENSDYDIDTFSQIISPSLIEACKKNNFGKLFPVQKHVVPSILSSFKNHVFVRPRDVCVSSPTGSGKTMAFALPIVQALMSRIKTEIRAIVVLPVRDLALQVFRVLSMLTAATNLKVGISIGHQAFTNDIENIIRKDETTGKTSTCIDILVATPSRLIDLIHNCPGFDLSHLRYLVLDEVDRIMDFEVEYNWLKEIDHAVYGRSQPNLCFCDNLESPNNRFWAGSVTCCNHINYTSTVQPYVKLLFSATLLKDAQALNSLNLFQPILFLASDEKSSRHLTVASKVNLIPKNLEEKFLVCSMQRKAHILWYFINNLGYRRVLCFARTVNRSRLLYNLMKNIPNLKVYEFSSSLKDKQRNDIFKKFKEGDFDLIIATDIMSRGIDIEGIQFVISYDVPYDDIQYVHRIGRTARAGQRGTAITFLTPEQVKNFSIMLRKVHPKSQIHERVKKINIKQSKLDRVRNEMKDAWKKLKKDKTAEDRRLQSFKESMPWRGLNRK